jgi:hypothetical protein
MNRIASTTSRMSVVLGRPPRLAAGTIGAISACGFRFYPAGHSEMKPAGVPI